MKAKAWLQIGVSSQLAFTARPTFGSINRRPKMRAGGKLEYSFGDGRYPLNRKSWEVFINSFTDPNIFILYIYIYIYIYMCVCVCVCVCVCSLGARSLHCWGQVEAYF